MNLGELISVLKERGNATMSWYGIETNVASVGELKDKDGKLFVELKVKE